jgi:hypothetical protein
MANTSKARHRTKKGTARARRAATRKIGRKRAKPARPARAARRPARAARRQGPAAGRPSKAAKRRVKKAGRPAKSLKTKTRPTARPPRAAQPKRSNPRPRTLARPPLDRARRVLADDERLHPGHAAGAEASDHLTSAAHAGHDAMRAERLRHTESSPELTAGDVDARWQDAYAVGDEAPGGDNPTPDQDRVDAIGHALGIEYQDGQELQGGEEVLERDKHRWELDPASSEDWPHKE